MAEPKPDLLQRSLHFGCGFLVGGAILFFAVVTWAPEPVVLGAIVGIGAVICGFMCARHGDAFLHWLFDNIRRFF